MKLMTDISIINHIIDDPTISFYSGSGERPAKNIM
jgi:hypothetical protein